MLKKQLSIRDTYVILGESEVKDLSWAKATKELFRPAGWVDFIGGMNVF